MTETAACPVCGYDVSIEVHSLEGDSISVDCDNCGASLKVVYKVIEIDTDVTVEITRFQCPNCEVTIEVEDPDEDGSEEFVCENCFVKFKVEWSDWGYTSEYEVLNESCPHCGETLDHSPEIGYRMARLTHLLDHALYAATSLNLVDFPDIAFWDIASAIDQDSWDRVARRAHNELFGLIDSLGPMTKKERSSYERKAVKWLKSEYPTVF